MLNKRILISIYLLLIAIFVSLLLSLPGSKTIHPLSPTPDYHHCQDMSFSLRNDCFTKYIIEYTDRNGVDSAEQELEIISNSSQGLSGSCHSVAHNYGTYLFKRYKTGAKYVIRDICGFGIGHGYLQEAGRELSPDVFVKELGDICLQSHNLSNCAHGIGHGLGEAGVSLSQGLKICEDISGAYKRKISPKIITQVCSEGIIMEDLNKNHEKWADKNLTLERATSICVGLSLYGEIGCKYTAISNWVQAPNLQPNTKYQSLARLKLFVTLCKSSNKDEFNYCGNYLGYTISALRGASYLTLNEAKNIEKFCDKSLPCYKGYLSSIYNLTNNDLPETLNYCALIDRIKDKCELLLKDSSI